MWICGISSKDVRSEAKVATIKSGSNCRSWPAIILVLTCIASQPCPCTQRHSLALPASWPTPSVSHQWFSSSRRLTAGCEWPSSLSSASRPPLIVSRQFVAGYPGVLILLLLYNGNHKNWSIGFFTCCDRLWCIFCTHLTLGTIGRDKNYRCDNVISKLSFSISLDEKELMSIAGLW